MAVEQYIRISDFCRGHALEETFLFELEEVELIQILEVGEERVIPRRDLDRLERLVRLHRDLDLSPQGLMAVDHLLARMQALREEMMALRRRLNRWE